MEQSPHSPQEERASSFLPVKLHELLDESDTEEETGNLQEEMVEEVMQEFYKEMIASSSPNPPSQVFINEGKNGSCGASVSDKGSSVMAGIEAVSAAGGWFPVTENGSSSVVGLGGGSDGLFELDDVGVGNEENNNNNTNNNNKKREEFFYDGVDLDDEWLGRVLSWGQQNQVQVVESRQWF